MTFFRILFVCLTGIAALPVFADATIPLNVMTDDRRPLAWQENGLARGIAYELVVATMKELGLNPSIEFTSFNRGLKLAQSQDNQAFFSVTRSPERNLTLKWVGPLVQNDVYVYKLKVARLKVETLEDLRSQRGIGVPRGMSQDNYLTELGLHNVMRTDTIANALRALVNKRVDVVAVGQLTMSATATEIGARVADFEETPLKLFDNPLYIAFSLNTSDDTIRHWQKALDKVKQEKYRTLFSTYVR